MDTNLKRFYWYGDINNYYLGHQFEEIFKSRIYDSYMNNKNNLEVIDCGANLGIFTIYAQKYAKRVYSIEPSFEHFSCLDKMVRENDYSNVSPFRFALANTDGKQTFYHLPNKTMYSLTPAAIDNTQIHEEVQTKRLDTFFKEQKIEHIDIFKLDCEGEEYNIICGDGFANIANKIDLVIGEIHSWANRHPNQLKEAFKNNGFSFEIIPGDAQLFVAKKQ